MDDVPRLPGAQAQGGARAKRAAPPAGPAAPERWYGPSEICPPLSEEQAAAATDKLFGLLVAGRKPAPAGKPPHLLLTLGPPGSGKSTVGRAALQHRSGVPAAQYVEVDFDSTLDLLPELANYRDTPDIEGRPMGMGFAYGWERCIGRYEGLMAGALQRLRAERYNILLQSHSQEQLIAAANAGYATTLLYVAVTPETATRRAGARARTTGRFFEPANAENAWGFDPAVAAQGARYRALAPWYALWADNFLVCVNEAEGGPGAEDFQGFESHPPLRPGDDWRGVVAAFGEVVAAAHKKAEEAAPPRKGRAGRGPA